MKRQSSLFCAFCVLFCAFCVPFLLLAAEPNKLADAAMRGDRAAVRMFLQQRVDVNFPQADGATALHWAVYHDDSEMTQLLLRAGANPKAVNREGASVLSLACENGDAVIIESLLKAGADANAKEKLRGTTALMWAAAQSHPAAIKLLIEHGADFAARSNPISKGRTAYLAPTPADRRRQGGAEAIAAGAGQFAGQGQRTGRGQRSAAAAADAQDPSGDSGPNSRMDGGGLTALVFAARQGALDSVKVLVEAGADVDQVTQYGWTPLLTAAQNKYYKVGSYLLDHGSNPNIANKGGWTPLYIATDNRNIEGGDYPVRKPDMDHLEYIKKLLSKGANPNARAIDSTETRTIFTMQWLYEDGATPFLRAAQSGDVALMKLLLQYGADPLIPTRNGDTALMVAAGIGWVE